MSEQNITNIIEYLDQNPDQTIESLVINLLNEGYPVEDIKEALDRQGISPLAIPGYKETIVYSGSKRSSGGKKMAIALLIIVSIILIVAIYLLIVYFARSVEEENAPAQPTNTEAVDISPITTMKATLAESDYKVTINSKIYYVDNGRMARKELNDGKIYLNWAGILTVIDINAKTYITYFSQTPQAEEFKKTVNEGLIPLEIIASTESGAVSWKKVNDTTWESTNVPKQRITYDPAMKLVTKRAFLNPDGAVSQEEAIQYEKITITNDLLGVPPGYTRITP